MGELKLEFEDKTLLKLINLIYHHTGIAMSEKKESMISMRLRPRIRELKLDSFEDYIAFLESHNTEVEKFVDAITTNETTFFRTPRIWEYFGKEFLKDWKKDHADQCLNIWSAAASSGEESYSIAMTCLENGVSNFKIIGTDISKEILEIGTSGIYSGRNSIEFQSKFPLLKDRYFDGSGETMIARRSLKDHISFSSHNLFSPLKSGTQFDIIFLRNVLIYFKNEDQQKVLKNVSFNLKKSGILILGESESIARLETSYKYKSPLIYTNE
jgi:chemotaxis protein methyltransferase CheR